MILPHVIPSRSSLSPSIDGYITEVVNSGTQSVQRFGTTTGETIPGLYHGCDFISGGEEEDQMGLGNYDTGAPTRRG